jgi:hypothetical protein
MIHLAYLIARLSVYQDATAASPYPPIPHRRATSKAVNIELLNFKEQTVCC